MNDLWTGIGIGLCVLFCCLGVGGCIYMVEKGVAERIKAGNEQTVKE